MIAMAATWNGFSLWHKLNWSHHKDAWVITWEIKLEEKNYDLKKVDHLMRPSL